MSPRNRTAGYTGGTRGQAAVPRGKDPLRANGLTLRGAVMATYVPIDGDESVAAKLSRLPPPSVYCDVAVYSRLPGFQGAVLRSVPVMGIGLHSGQVWHPRAATLDLSGKGLRRIGSDPADLDADHVLIQFLDDNLSQPFVSGLAVHPRAGLGNEDRTEPGHRMRLKLVDGSPSFAKHRGSFFGVDTYGNFVVDTTRAHGGEYTEEGQEVPADSMDHGNVTIRANAKTAVRVLGVDVESSNPKYELTVRDDELVLKLRDGATLKINGKDSAASLTLGDGANHAVNFENLNTWWETMKVKFALFDTHIHATGVGPSGTPVPVLSATSLPSDVKSTKIAMPDG